MTNAEKFKEVFGFEINEEVCCTNAKHCSECFLDSWRHKEKAIGCSESFWQSEYKEPNSKVEFDVAFWRRQCMESWNRVAELDKIIDDNNTEWKEAIENIKAEIEKEKADAKNNSTAYYIYIEGLMDAHETDEQIIDKHTKELL